MPRVGDVLRSRYRIEGLLGAGGMATVHRATDLRLGRSVAVKILLPNLARDPDLAARFEREARALAAVGHPAIVEIYDIEAGDAATGEESFIVMELCEDGSLAERLAADGRLPPDEVVPLAGRVAEGLAALHAAGIVHRDVKPQNILLSPTGPKLADFGIAKLESVPMRETLTSTGAVLGSVAYSPPELLAGEPATEASDVYGLATVVYQGLTGRRPRDETSLAGAIESRLTPPDLASSVAPELGPAFDGALAAALAPDPRARPELLAFTGALDVALGRWEREGGSREATAEPPAVGAAAPAEPAEVDAEATTIVEPSGVGPLPTEPSAPAADIVAPAARRWPVPLAIAGLAIAAMVLVTAASLDGLLGTSVVPSSSVDALQSPARVSPSPSPAAPSHSPSPSPSPASPSPSPPPEVGPLSPEEALEAVRDAVRDARHQLDDDDIEKLADQVDKIESALDEEDVRSATQEARDLTKRVDELIRRGKIDGEVADSLDEATDALLTVLRADS